jgi:hypothetical protein
VAGSSPRDARQWGGLIFDGVDASSQLHNATVRYAPVRLLGGAAPQLYSNRLMDAPGAGLEMTPDAAPDLRANRMEQNGIAGLAILTGTMLSDQEWVLLGGVEDQLVRVLLGEVTVGARAVLNLDPGVVVKADTSGKLTVLGGLRADGRADRPIVFTALRDDLIGGDTDGRALDPAPGDWRGLEVGPASEAHFAHTSVHYAQVGLFVRGETMPVVDEGRLQLADGVQALACDAPVAIPTAFLIERNEIDTRRCPTQ